MRLFFKKIIATSLTFIDYILTTYVVNLKAFEDKIYVKKELSLIQLIFDIAIKIILLSVVWWLN